MGDSSFNSNPEESDDEFKDEEINQNDEDDDFY